MEPIHTRSEKKTRHDQFTLREAVMDDPAYMKLKLVELRLLDKLMFHMDDDGHCWPSVRTLAAHVVPGFDGDNVPSYFYTALTSLEEKKFVRIKRGKGGRGTPNHYWVKVPSETSVKRNVKTSVKLYGKRRSNCTGNVGQFDRQNSYSTPSETPTRTRRGGVSGGSPAEMSKEDRRVIKAFRKLGVERTKLIKVTLKAEGVDWMKRVLKLIDAKDARDEIETTPAIFAVFLLKHPQDVMFDLDPPTRKKKRKKKSTGDELSMDYLSGEYSYNGNGRL